MYDCDLTQTKISFQNTLYYNRRETLSYQIQMLMTLRANLN